MSWWAIDVLAEPAERETLGAWMVARTGQAVEERDDGTLVAFAPDEAAAEVLMAEVGARTEGRAATGRRPATPVDWSTRWRDGLAARRIGRLTVAPSWLAEAALPGETTVVLDPETAFGSGEHGSTRAALALLERHLRPGDQVLDLGSGSGILAVAAVGIDTDAGANEVAARNAGRNGVGGRVTFLCGDASDLAPLVGPADFLLANILRGVNVALLPAAARALRPQGLAVFSGMESAEAELFRPALLGAGMAEVDEVTDAGWWAVAARRG